MFNINELAALSLGLRGCEHFVSAERTLRMPAYPINKCLLVIKVKIYKAFENIIFGISILDYHI